MKQKTHATSYSLNQAASLLSPDGLLAVCGGAENPKEGAPKEGAPKEEQPTSSVPSPTGLLDKQWEKIGWKPRKQPDIITLAEQYEPNL